MANAKVQIIVDATDKASRKLGKVAGTMNGMAEAVEALAVPMAAAGAATLGLAAIGVKSAISLESAWTGVTKTTDGLADEFGNMTAAGEDLQRQFRDMAMETPIAVEELMKIGELGGQLGVAAGDLDDFTKVIAAMGASTNLTTEEAATGFARLANVMGTVEAEGSAAWSKLGSSIVALGNNFATTESDILAFAQRIAGAGEIAGLAESEVLAIGAAMSSVGVQAEAGGTAVQKVLLAINEAALMGGDSLTIFAQTAGLAVDEFAQMWQVDAAGAFTLFVEGLGNAGDDAIAILDSLELTDQRLVRSFLSLANAGGLLNETIDLSNIAWEENSALAAEAAKRYATTESNLQMFKNTLKDVGAGLFDSLLPGLNAAADGAQDMLMGFRDLPAPLQDTIAEVGLLGGGLLTAAGGIGILLPKLAGIGTAISGLAASVGLSTTALLGPVGLIAALGALVIYAKNVEDAHEKEAAAVGASSKNYNDYTVLLKDAGVEAHGLTQELFELAKAQTEVSDAMADTALFEKMQEAQDALTESMGRAYEASGLVAGGIADFAQAELEALVTTDEYAAMVVSETNYLRELANVYELTDTEAAAFISTLELKAKAHLLNLDAVREETVAQDDYDDSLGLTVEQVAELTAGLRESAPVMQEEAAATGIAADEMAALAAETGLTVSEIHQLSSAMGMGTGDIAGYAAAIQTAQGMVEGFVGAVTEGVGGLRDLQSSADDNKATLKELGIALVNNEATLAQFDGTAQSYAGTQRALNGVERQQTLTRNELNAVTLEYENRLASLDKKSEEYKQTKEDLKAIALDYKGTLGELDQQADSYKLTLDGLRTGSDAYADAQRENEQLTKQHQEALVQVQADTDAYNWKMLELTLSIAEQTNALQAWAEQEFGPDLAPMADSAQEVIRLLDEGVIALDGDLATMVGNYAKGVQDVLAETETLATENKQVVNDMMTNLEDEAETTKENLQKAFDMKDMLPYEDAVAAGVALGQGIEAGIPDDPFASLLTGFAGARESIVTESGLIAYALSAIPTDVDIAATLDGVPQVLGLAKDVTAALGDIPTDIAINIHAEYSGDGGATEWTPSIALAHALEDLVKITEDEFPLSLGMALAGSAEDLESLLKLAGQVGRIGGGFAGMYEKRMEGRIAALKEQQEALMMGGLTVREAAEWVRLEEERAELAREYAEEQEKILHLQEQQQQLAFLQQQFDLLKMVQDAGLDAGAILGGLEFGIDASIPDLIAAMQAAMQAMIDAAATELQLGSPSRVFEQMTKQAMLGAAMGVDKFAALPALAVNDAMTQMIDSAAARLGGAQQGPGNRLASGNSYNLTIITGAEHESIVQDFRMMESWAGGSA